MLLLKGCTGTLPCETPLATGRATVPLVDPVIRSRRGGCLSKLQQVPCFYNLITCPNRGCVL